VQLTPQEEVLLDMLERALRDGRSIEEARRTLTIASQNPALVENVIQIHLDIALATRTIALSHAIGGSDATSAWYTGPSEDDLY